MIESCTPVSAIQVVCQQAASLQVDSRPIASESNSNLAEAMPVAAPPNAFVSVASSVTVASEQQATAPATPEQVPGSSTVPINLPTALVMIGGQHPVVGFAQWRVQEAYAQLDRAKVMWLPSIQTGFNYRRRDGNYQAVDGEIVDVNLNSMNYGLGAGAVAAGSPTRPGVVA